MNDLLTPEALEENRFKTVSSFRWCVNNGGEVEFSWQGKTYSVLPLLQSSPFFPLQILRVQKFVENPAETERWYNTADELLDDTLDGTPLRDVITQLEVTIRTI